MKDSDFDLKKVLHSSTKKICIKYIFYAKSKSHSFFCNYFTKSCEIHPQLVKLIKYIPEEEKGSWYDLVYLYDNCNNNPIIKNEIIEVYSNQLIKDSKSDTISICFKFLPQERQKKSDFYKRIAEKLFPDEVKYKSLRKLKISLKSKFKKHLFCSHHEIVRYILNKNSIEEKKIKQCTEEWNRLNTYIKEGKNFDWKTSIPVLHIFEWKNMKFIYIAIALSIVMSDKNNGLIMIGNTMINLKTKNLFEKIHMINELLHNLHIINFDAEKALMSIASEINTVFIFTDKIITNKMLLAKKIKILDLILKKERKFIFWSCHFFRNICIENIIFINGLYYFYVKQLLNGVIPHKKKKKFLIENSYKNFDSVLDSL